MTLQTLVPPTNYVVGNNELIVRAKAAELSSLPLNDDI